MKLKKTLSAVTATVLSCSLAFAVTGCDPKDPAEKDPVITGIQLIENAEIEAGATSNVIKEIQYSDGSTKKTSDSEIVWASSAEAVATVNRGVVTGKAAGNATVSATWGDVKSNDCAITVISAREVTITSESIAEGKITLDKETNPTAKLVATITRDGKPADGEIVWSTSDENKLTVDDKGNIKAIMDTAEGETVKVIATIKDTTIKSEVPVVINWANKENYTFGASTYEQNKSPAGIWNYWGDKNYNWTNTNISAAYVDPTYEEAHKPQEGYQYIGAQKVTIEYKVDNPDANVAAVQLFYRSAGEEGKLLTNHNYEVTLKLDTNVAGTISLNDYRNLPEHTLDGVEVGEITEGTEEEEAKYEFELVEGTNTLTVQFRHGDTGAIYANGIYDNIESAIQLCLGKLAGNVVVSVYDIQYKDLGEATKKWQDNPANLAEESKPADLPDLGDAQAIEFALDAENKDPGETEQKGVTSVYTITGGADGKSSTVEYKTYTTTYEALYVNVSENEAAQNGNLFAATVKNNGTTDAKVRFDLNGTEEGAGYKNCVLSWVASNGGKGQVDSYGGTELTVKAGEEVTIYYTYSTEGQGTLENIAIYFDTLWWSDGVDDPNWAGKVAERTGNITISNLTFAKGKELVEGEKYEAAYTEYNNDGDTLSAKDTWGVWYAQDASWNCGNAITLGVNVDADAKSCTINYNANGNENNWGIQLRYIPEDIVEGQLYKVKLTINTNVAYSITLNGKTIALEVGNNDVELQWTAGTYILDGQICKANSNEDITLVISNLTWTELVYAD